MLKVKKKNEQNKSLLLSDVDEEDEFSINGNNNENKQKQVPSDNNNHTAPFKIRRVHFTWKCMCLASLLTTIITIIIIIIVIFASILPNVAQSTINYATMEIINGTMYDPTNTSITLNATIEVSNTGTFSGTIPPITATVFNNNVKIGTMKMPQIQTIANQPSIISMTTVLHVTNSNQFKKSTKQLMKNIDQIWTISANNIEISVDSGIVGTLHFKVNLNKDLILPGIHLYDFVASNFDANSATNVTINAISDIDFVADSMLTLILPMTLLQIYMNDVYIGYIGFDNLTIKSGHNTAKNHEIIIDSNGFNNREQIGEFISQYVMNHNQNITIKGPYSRKVNNKNYKPLVIDGIMEQHVVALGYSFGALAFGSTVTSETQSGWSVPGLKNKVRGAYANLMNPFNVPLKMVNLSGDAYLKYPFGYTVEMIPFDYYKCPITNKYAHLHIGKGIYKNNASKTWVDVPANGKKTFFTIAEPMKETNASKKTCFGMPFSCCFATLGPGYICKLNDMSKHVDDELNVAFMSLELYSNITVLIDNKFNVTMKYNQPFFPVYFGYEMYSGYIGDAEISCSSYVFH